MGSEASTEASKKETFMKEELYPYQKEFNDMRNSIEEKDKDINNMMIEKRRMNDTIKDLENKLLDALNSKETLTENLEEIKAERNDLHEEIEDLKINLEEKDLEAFKIERNDLYKTIGNLKKQLEEKDIEMKKKLAEAKKNIESITKELNKYKSMTQFESLMKLNSDSIDFQGKIESIVASNCDLLQVNEDDCEIESIKRKNAELYCRLNNSNIKAFVMQKSVELRDAENELNIKKEFAQKEFLRINGKLMIMKDKIAQITKQLDRSIENATDEFLTYQKEVHFLEEENKQISGTLSYDRIKIILLEQQYTLMDFNK